MVLHNLDIMSIIGKSVVEKNKNTFIATCKLWRYVYYTKLAVVEDKNSPRDYIFQTGSYEACTYILQRSKLNEHDFGNLLRSTKDVYVINIFLDVVGEFELTKNVALLHLLLKHYINNDQQRIFFVVNRIKVMMKTRYHDMLWILTNILLLDLDLSNNDIALICKDLNCNDFVTIWYNVLNYDVTQLMKVLPHMKMSEEIIRSYINQKTTNKTVFEYLCNSFLTMYGIVIYTGLYNYKIHQLNNRLDIYLRVGFLSDQFFELLLKKMDYHDRINSIARIVEFGLVNPYTQTKYNFGIPSTSKMTMFEYANHSTEKDLYEFIINDPRFKVMDHIQIMSFGIKNGRKKIGYAYIKLLKTQEDLERALQRIQFDKDVSRKKDKSLFDDYIYKITKKLSKLTALNTRKKPKIDTDET